MDMIDALESNRWIDVYTRAIFVEFNLLNPNTAMANTGKIIFEYPTQGNKLWSTRMEVVQLYRYTRTEWRPQSTIGDSMRHLRHRHLHPGSEEDLQESSVVFKLVLELGPDHHSHPVLRIRRAVYDSMSVDNVGG